MILRGVFWMGLVWLCMTHGPDLGLAPARAACGACEDPLQGKDMMRRQVLARLATIKIELHEAALHRHGDSVAGAGEAVRRFSERLADAANHRGMRTSVRIVGNGGFRDFDGN